MNRRQRAIIRSKHEELEMNREFKNDALWEMRDSFGRGDERFRSENEIFNRSKKQLRKLKKYNGPCGFDLNSYKELMGA